LRGLLVLFAALAATAISLVGASAVPSAMVSWIVTAAIVGALGAFLLYRTARLTPSTIGLLIKIVAVLIGFAAAGSGLASIGLALESGRTFPLILPLLSLPVVLSAFWWMAAPTKAGREVMDRIAGFKQYMSITEEERLERMHPPEKTPELFEKYLPYAIALQVENQWADRFAGVLAAASVAGQAQGMAWYSGHGDPWNRTGDFVDQVGSSLSSTVASASSAPGSSSGSGGGGSSGGGGGGGGGGGW
jgi:uncharacterized membrane protein